MGLLDILDTPETQLGVALMAAGGSTTDPNKTGFGQRMMAARNDVNAMQMGNLKQKMLGSELQLNNQQVLNLKNWQQLWGGNQQDDSQQGTQKSALQTPPFMPLWNGGNSNQQGSLYRQPSANILGLGRYGYGGLGMRY